jgi:hypothetical protein
MAGTNWRKVSASDSVEKSAETASSVLMRTDRIELELIRRGIPSESSGTLARQVQRQLDGVPEHPASLVLDGVALAFSVGAVQRDAPVGGFRQARVVDQLLTDFGDEVQKLDEIVKVLNAYLRRLRNPEVAPHRRRLQ